MWTFKNTTVGFEERDSSLSSSVSGGGVSKISCVTFLHSILSATQICKLFLALKKSIKQLVWQSSWSKQPLVFECYIVVSESCPPVSTLTRKRHGKRKWELCSGGNGGCVQLSLFLNAPLRPRELVRFLIQSRRGLFCHHVK